LRKKGKKEKKKKMTPKGEKLYTGGVFWLGGFYQDEGLSEGSRLTKEGQRVPAPFIGRFPHLKSRNGGGEGGMRKTLGGGCLALQEGRS